MFLPYSKKGFMTTLKGGGPGWGYITNDTKVEWYS